jgi:ParB family chromosome partitioning protein
MTETVRDLPISRLSPHPGNVRGGIAPDEAEEMALSILLMGVIQPLVVTIYNGDFRVVDGHVRLAGAMRLLETNRWPQDRPQSLPVIVRDLTPGQQRAIMLSTNVVRYALNPVDEGLAYLRMVQEDGLSKSAVAERCGVSPARVESRLCIAGLAPPVMEMFRRGELPLGAAVGRATPLPRPACRPCRRHLEPHLPGEWAGPGATPRSPQRLGSPTGPGAE